jgi:hypothetical protein
MASNNQFGTNSLAGSDWTRMKRLSRIINGTTKNYGSSIIRAPASDQTDITAARHGTFITRARTTAEVNAPNTPVLTLNYMYGSCYNNESIIIKIANCVKCSYSGTHNRI